MSVINKKKDSNVVEFVSYSGSYPSLCSGTLVYKVNGVTHTHKGLTSGGSCGFTNGYSDSYINTGEWIIDATDFPVEVQPYIHEIDVMINENINHGCCGGCL